MTVEPSFDALMPPDMATKIEAVGVTKASLPLARMVPLGVLAGAFIGLGAHFSTVVTADTSMSPGISRLLGGLVFSLGLVLVVVSGAELFTGNTLIAVATADWGEMRWKSSIPECFAPATADATSEVPTIISSATCTAPSAESGCASSLRAISRASSASGSARRRRASAVP